jgi:photosystem II stability/assembly factor-like uncharacterized protein
MEFSAGGEIHCAEQGSGIVVSKRYGRSTKQAPLHRGGTPRSRRSGIKRALSPLGLAAVLVVLTGTGVTAYAVTATSSVASGSTGVGPGATSSATTTPAPHIETPVAGGASAGVGAYNAVSCSSPTSCIAAGATSSGAAQIGISTNGGSTYSSASLPSGIPALHAVSCEGNSLCVAVGVNHIVTSSDGGKSWKDHALADTGLSLLGVTCSTSSLCLAAGSESTAQRPSAQAPIYRSLDQGASWTLTSVPPQVVGIGAIACPTTTVCIAVGSSVLKSTDGGSTWQQMGVTGKVQQLTSIACSSSTTCIAVGPNPEGVYNHALGADAVETTDGGANFHSVSFPYYSASLFEVSCASTTSCIASGAEGTGITGPAFVASSDGGVTWNVATPPPTFSAVAGISCPSGGSCVLVGQTPSGAATSSLSPQGEWSAVKVDAGQ